MGESFSFKYYLKRVNSKGNRLKIYGRLIVNRKKAELYAGFQVPEEAWNEEAGRTHHNISINQELSAIENRVYEIRRKLIDDGIPVTARNIIDHFKGLKKGKTYLLQFFQEHINYITTKGELAAITFSQYKTTFKIVKQFVEKRLKAKDILIREVDFSFIEHLDHFMISEYRDPYNRPIARNTVNKHHTRFRTLLIKALNEDIILKNPYNRFKLKDTKTRRDFLTTDELNKLKDFDLGNNQSLQKVRDIFLFSCFTGLRFTDASNLKMNDIITDENGVMFVSLKMKKTKDFIQVPLIGDAVEILKRYDDHPDREVLGFLLPRISNQKVNAYLKELSNLAGIQKTITHHVGRHTFATHALNKGIPIEVVQKLLGHTDIQTTQIYARMLTSTIVREMEKMGKVRND